MAYDWFKSYLKNRQQCVRIGDVCSNMGTITQGVPQGSVLGAILFLIYMNDLCGAKFKGNITSFADDTAITNIGNNWQDVQNSMKTDLCALQWWFSENRMLLSPEKTKFINFNLNSEINFLEPLKYTCADCLIIRNDCLTDICSEVKQTNTIKYLGVLLDQEVNLKTHIRSLKDKLN